MLIENVFENFNDAVKCLKKLRNKSAACNVRYYQYDGKYYVVYELRREEWEKKIV